MRKGETALTIKLIYSRWAEELTHCYFSQPSVSQGCNSHKTKPTPHSEGEKQQTGFSNWSRQSPVGTKSQDVCCWEHLLEASSFLLKGKESAQDKSLSAQLFVTSSSKQWCNQHKPPDFVLQEEVYFSWSTTIFMWLHFKQRHSLENFLQDTNTSISHYIPKSEVEALDSP